MRSIAKSTKSVMDQIQKEQLSSYFLDEILDAIEYRNWPYEMDMDYDDYSDDDYYDCSEDDDYLNTDGCLIDEQWLFNFII